MQERDSGHPLFRGNGETYRQRRVGLIRKRLLLTALLFLSFIFVDRPSVARQRVRPAKVRVRFLATSTFVRGVGGTNEDIYLAELLGADGEPTLIRLIDEYSNLINPLDRASVTSQSGTILPVIRDPNCDLAYGQMILRTAPGDPLAILPERLGYEPQLDNTPKPDAPLPCYRTARR